MLNSEWKHLPIHHFEFGGNVTDVQPLMIGHINDTYIVQCKTSAGRTKYILQRINTNVFKKPKQVMENIEAVTQHLRKKIIAQGGDPLRETLNLIRTKDNGIWFESPEGDFWRAYYFIDGARTYETVDDPVYFYNAGEAFGRFQNLLQDFPAHQLHETIPRFHDTQKRFHDLMKAAEADPKNKVKDVHNELEFARQRADQTGRLIKLLASGNIPLRVVHNDTKLNNVLIDDETGKGICVLDLDTVMPGTSLFDFGDAIRFGASTATEDEEDLSKVRIDLELFRQFTRGYLSTTASFLTDTEIDHFVFSAQLMTYEVGIRFLTDHIQGDVYFKTHRPDHNLQRARTQFQLLSDMEQNEEAMTAIVEKERQRFM